MATPQAWARKSSTAQNRMSPLDIAQSCVTGESFSLEQLPNRTRFQKSFASIVGPNFHDHLYGEHSVTAWSNEGLSYSSSPRTKFSLQEHRGQFNDGLRQGRSKPQQLAAGEDQVPRKARLSFEVLHNLNATSDQCSHWIRS